MTMQHGTQPTNKPAKPISDDHKERKRGVKPVLPPRDGTTRTEGVSEAHKAEDKHKMMPKNSPENLGPDALPKSKKNVPTDTYDVDENLREY